MWGCVSFSKWTFFYFIDIDFYWWMLLQRCSHPPGSELYGIFPIDEWCTPFCIENTPLSDGWGPSSTCLSGEGPGVRHVKMCATLTFLHVVVLVIPFEHRWQYQSIWSYRSFRVKIVYFRRLRCCVHLVCNSNGKSLSPRFEWELDQNRSQIAC
jgi:hypothetical protein